MAEMQRLKVDFSDTPNAAAVPPKRLSVEFFDLLDAVRQAQPEQMPQLPMDSLYGKKILKVDFSDIPYALPEPKVMDLSSLNLPVANSTGPKENPWASGTPG